MKRIAAIVCGVLLALSSGCVSYSAYYASSRGSYRETLPASRDEAYSALVRELAGRGAQFSATDRASGIITVPHLALTAGMYDCNLLLANGQPAYTIVTAVADIQFLVDGNGRQATVTATAQFLRVVTRSPLGVDRIGVETCYSTHLFERDIVESTVRRLGK